MPEVTVCCRPKGLPMATTKSPTRSRCESAKPICVRPSALDPEHRQVHVGVHADQFGIEPPAVGEGDLELVGAFDEVVVGDDVARAGIDHHARTRALHPLGNVEEPPEEGVAHQGVRPGADPGGSGHVTTPGRVASSIGARLGRGSPSTASGSAAWTAEPNRMANTAANDLIGLPLGCSQASVERAMGVEPTSPAWEAGVMTVIRRPRTANYGTVSLNDRWRTGAPFEHGRGLWIGNRSSTRSSGQRRFSPSAWRWSFRFMPANATSPPPSPARSGCRRRTRRVERGDAQVVDDGELAGVRHRRRPGTARSPTSSPTASRTSRPARR